MKDIVKIAFVDDDMNSLQIISEKTSKIFSDNGFVAIVSTFNDANSYLNSLNSENYGFSFFDIEMPEITGIQLAALIKDNKGVGNFVFVSNREDLVFESLTTKPYGFVRKSLLEKDLNQIVRFYISDKEKEGKMSLSFQIQSNVITVPIKEIIYIEAVGKKQNIYLKQKKEPLQVHNTSKELLEKTKDYHFIETYKGIIVNCRYIKAINKDSIELTSGSNVFLSRRKAQYVKKEFLKFINSTLPF